ncbi:actin [Babesia gibsoni]|uniref:Actin n=1 Tax=Babesia gibsoni TaxID=33632 RepID=A0AAD8PET2_BABGI|nr:actin [Babesia gibsoni]
MADEILAVVVDTGSYKVKAGFSGADAPQVTFRSLAAYGEGVDVEVGPNAVSKIGSLPIMHPVQHGIVRNWALAERIWRHVYNELKASPIEHPVLLSEPPLNPKLHRERICQLFFESFDVPGLYMAPSSLLALYGSAKTTGLVLDIGEGVAHTVPISDGTIIPHAVGRLDVGGYDVTSNLLASIPSLNHESPMDREIANNIKETCCYVSSDYHEDIKNAQRNPESFSKRYTLPDGSVITLSKECFHCPEMLFNPEAGGRNSPRLVDSIYHSIRGCEPELHRNLFSNILLTGGSSLFSCFPERCEKDIRELVNGNANVKVHHGSKNRDTTVWVGGSVVAALSTFQQMWVTRADYDESGPTVIHRKCF